MFLVLERNAFRVYPVLVGMGIQPNSLPRLLSYTFCIVYQKGGRRACGSLVVLFCG